MGLRRFFYQKCIQQKTCSKPVIVVGNLTVGGTGKTPFVIFLATELKRLGFKPAIISRGYSGDVHALPRLVSSDDRVEKIGDEPRLMADATGVPVVVCIKRLLAAQYIEENQPDIDVIISDDGLQHYALPRSKEIILIDGVRQLGNQMCLPAGPLREPVSRLKTVDWVLVNGEQTFNHTSQHFTLKPKGFWQLNNPTNLKHTDAFIGQQVHAVAGIGNPERFALTLSSLGMTPTLHPKPDHATYDVSDFLFDDNLPIVITEKDAVKCSHIDNPNIWVVKVGVEMNSDIKQKLLLDLAEVISDTPAVGAS